MRTTRHAWTYIAWFSAVISCFSTALIGAFPSLLFTQLFAPLAVRFHMALLLLCFFDCGRPCFWNFYSTIPVDVVRVKSCVSCLFNPVRLVTRVMINKLYFIPEWLVSSVVGMLWNGGGLSTSELNVSIMLRNSDLHRSSSLSDVHLAAFTGNPVNYIIMLSRIDSVFWLH